MPVYRITKQAIEALPETTFPQRGIKEREDLQRLLRTNISVVDPDVLVIAEEFAEWEDSKRRIDLLGVDTNGNLVVIELKRDEDGGHMELQAIRYAAMVSGMRFSRAVEVYQSLLDADKPGQDAKSKLLSFLGWEEAREDHFARGVRIVLVSAGFSKELTTAVLWLNSQDLDIRCVRLRPFAYGGDTVVDVQQVVPLPEAREYTIRLKAKELAVRTEDSDRHDLRLAFWRELLAAAKTRTPRFAKRAPSEDHWLGVSAGIPGIAANYLIWQDCAGCEIYIDGGADARDWNKAVFDHLFAKRDEIELAYGRALAWQRLDNKRACRIMDDSIDRGIRAPREEWSDIRERMIAAMEGFERAVLPRMKDAVAAASTT